VAEQAGPVRIAVLGSTGSIGTQTLDVVAALSEHLTVTALAAGRDAALLGEQVRRLRPAVAALTEGVATLAETPTGTETLSGRDALEEIAVRDDVDVLVVATGGLVALRATLAALRAGKVVATANKETLVAAGHLVMPLAHERAGSAPGAAGLATPLAWLRPIDSEHSALWQCLVGERIDEVARLVLTASGGPFRGWSADRLARATPADALAHPTWRMGAKITIDSATLMNKGLEVIEARWLYDVPDEGISVVVHPQSIVHSAVEFVDGSVKAQLGHPDMRLPIQYALTYPRRAASPAPPLSLAALDALSFEAPDEERFPALGIAREASRRGPWATAALICVDEVAVARFLDGTLSFPGIAALARAAVERFGNAAGVPDVDDLEELDREVAAWAGTALRDGAA
jgi:1-deoxy-D-xylulose-5-phosphate reductoisomerase